MAHQIKHFFQYQEEKLQRSESWDGTSEMSAKKEPLLVAPLPGAQPRPHDGMDPASLSYYEHKSKLRKTQVNHRVPGEQWECEEGAEDGEEARKGEKTDGSRSSTGHPPSHKYSRTARDRPGRMIDDKFGHFVSCLAIVSLTRQMSQVSEGAKSARSHGHRLHP